jgi:cytohesin
MVKILLERGADVDSTDTENMTALHLAAQMGHVGLVKLLISSGANANAVSKTYGETPLHLAVTSANAEVVKLLVENGADVHWATYHAGETALHLASSRGLNEVVMILLERCDINTENLSDLPT